MPHYITWDHDYLQGAVSYYDSEYFYLPVDPNTIGDFAVLVNKTTPYSTENGDLNLTMIIHPGAGFKNWQTWGLPKNRRYMGLAANGQNNQPEVIEVCEEAIRSWCSFQNRTECSLMFRVMGRTPDTTSFFRMKVFNGTNKIQPN